MYQSCNCNTMNSHTQNTSDLCIGVRCQTEHVKIEVEESCPSSYFSSKIQGLSRPTCKPRKERLAHNTKAGIRTDRLPHIWRATEINFKVRERLKSEEEKWWSDLLIPDDTFAVTLFTKGTRPAAPACRSFVLFCCWRWIQCRGHGLCLMICTFSAL